MKVIKSLIIVACICFSLNSYAQDAPKDEPAAQECVALKQVMDDAKENFQYLKGSELRKGNDKDIPALYASKISFPGADSVIIEKGKQQIYRAVLATESYQSSELVDQYLNLVEQFHTCLSDSFSFEEIKDENIKYRKYRIQANSGAANDMYQPTMGVILQRNENNTYSLILEVAEPYFKDNKKKK
jgi:hypothetical protein